MKKFIVGLLSILAIGVTVPLFACSKSSAPEYKKFNSFAEYKNFDQCVVAIDVQWDVGGRYDEFTVTDTEQINDIIDLFNGTTMIKKEGLRAGDNHGIEFVYGDGTTKGVSLFTVSENGAYYYYQDLAIRDYISQLRSGTNN